jgi:hypothetical protein
MPAARGVTCRLEVFDNHPIAVIDGRRVVIDIGSPISIGNSELLGIAGVAGKFEPQVFADWRG